MNRIHVRSLGNSDTKKIEMAKTVRSIISTQPSQLKNILSEQQINAVKEIMRRYN